MSYLEPLSAAARWEAVGAAIQDEGSVESVAEAIDGFGALWYPTQARELQEFARALAAIDLAARPAAAAALADLRRARLCTARTAAAAAAALHRCLAPDGIGPIARQLVGLCAGVRQLSAADLPAAVPALLRGLCGGCLDGAAVGALLRLLREGLLQPGPVLDEVQRDLAEAAPRPREFALKLLHITAFDVIGDQAAAQPLSGEEWRCIIACASRAAPDEAYAGALADLAGSGLQRIGWRAVLDTLGRTPPEGQREALSRAQWFSSMAPAWLPWTEEFAQVEALPEGKDTVLQAIAMVLGAGEEQQLRPGKDEDFAAGASPSLRCWVRLLVRVAPSARWRHSVTELYARVLPLDPQGKSSLVANLCSTHRVPCRWVAPKALRVDCYCEYVVRVAVPQLGRLCGGLSFGLLEGIATFVKWRRGPQLEAMVALFEAVASSRPRLLQSEGLAEALLRRHELLWHPRSGEAVVQIADASPQLLKLGLDSMGGAADRLGADAKLLALELVTACLLALRGTAAWPGAAGFAHGLAIALAVLLARAPPELCALSDSWLVRLLSHCCTHLGGYAAAHLSQVPGAHAARGGGKPRGRPRPGDLCGPLLPQLWQACREAGILRAIGKSAPPCLDPCSSLGNYMLASTAV